MQKFTIAENGKISDGAVQAAIAALRADVPGLDETAVESHMMMFRAYAAYFTSTASRYEELGLSHARFNVLRWLYQAPEHRMTITELGACLEATVPNVLRLVGALEDDGWVRRVRSEADRRVMFVELTHEGCQRFRDLLPRAVEMWEELQAGLSPEEQSLLSHLLAKLRMSMLSRYIGRDLLSYRIDARRRKASPMR